MRTGILAVTVALVTGSVASPQSDTSASWPVGSRVRVWTTTRGHVVGNLTELRGDTLIIHQEGKLFGSRARVSSSEAVRLDISDGRRISTENVVLGALGGAGVGIVTTLILDEALGDTCLNISCEDTKTDYVGPALVGLALGAVAGLTQLEDRWKEVTMPRRVRLSSRAGRMGIGLSIAFR